MSKLWKKKARKRAARKAVLIGLASILAITCGAYGGVKLFHVLTKPKPEEVIVDEVEEIEDEVVATQSEYVPEFKKVVITSESVEKDFTIYISDDEDNNVAGTKFSIKLVEADNIKAVEPFIGAIDELNKKIDELSTGEENNQLYLDKEVAMEAYSIALNDVPGSVYVDEDEDGVISEKDIDPGKYIACLLYDEAWEVNYEPSDYNVTVEVKDNLEYKVVKNITKKIAKDKSSEDGQKEEKTATEATLEDTVAYVESSDKTSFKVKTTKEAVAPASSSVSSSLAIIDDSAKTANHSYSNTVTVTYKYIDENGNEISSDGLTKSQPVNKGTKIKVLAPTIEGYTHVESDPKEGTELSIDKDTTITYKYQANTAYVPSWGMLASRSVRPVIAGYFTNGIFKLCEEAANGAAIEQSVTISAEGGTTVYVTASISGNPAPTVTSVTVGGKEAKLNNGKYEATISAGKEVEILANVTFGDGSTGVAKLKVKATETAGNSTEVLKDKSGNTLYLDEKCEKEAKASDYVSGGTYYYKVETHSYTGWQTINGVTYYYDKDGKVVTGTQVIQGVKYSFGNDGALLVSGTGIDVSKYQGDINWSKASSAISFAIIRCGYRGMYDGILHEDPYFYKNMKNAKANGVAVGIYIYSTALNEAEAVEEASMAVAMANAAGGCSYPIFFDMEDTTRGVSKLSTAQRNAIVKAFCTTVQGSGYKAGVYSNVNWFNNRLTMSDLSSNIYVWVARYNTTLGYNGRYNIWQYSDKGTIPGIKGSVDVNKSYF